MMEPSVAILAAVMVLLSPMLSDFGMSESIEKDRDEIYCAAQNIYFESRGEPDVGQVAVAQVVLNRVYDKRWPDTICEVVWQPTQFSWTHDGRSDRIKLNNKINRQAWIKSVFYAIMSMTENDITNGATHYHNTNITPWWTSSMKQTAVIGNHIFYR